MIRRATIDNRSTCTYGCRNRAPSPDPRARGLPDPRGRPKRGMVQGGSEGEREGEDSLGSEDPPLLALAAAATAAGRPEPPIVNY